ncbi:MAG TPA: hypothetical protein VFY28_02210 [Candidatus Paceibacterota bacterium]|nr:hypothetical protein [Candidatus Paceibacterota bacterium]
MFWNRPSLDKRFGEKREVKKPADGSEAPAIIARDALGNPIGTAQSGVEAEHLQTENAQEMKEAA